MGASGIIGGLVDGSGKSTAGERVAFLVASVATPVGLALAFRPEIATHLTPNLLVVAVAGFCWALAPAWPTGARPATGSAASLASHSEALLPLCSTSSLAA